VRLWILVAVGGALGTMARYGMEDLVHRYMPPFFPAGTFAVNTLGCLIFGVIVSLADERFVIGPAGRAFLLVGICGGFTTFSTFTFETFGLLRDGELGPALLNAGGQVMIGLVAMWTGYLVPRVL
jgi:CrcB protein